MLSRPLIVVNAKSYPQATGRALDDLLEAIGGAGSGSLVVAVQPADIPRAAGHGLDVLAQHVDPEPLGSRTGRVTPESVRDAGAVGSILNHSERPVELSHAARAVQRLAALDLTSIVCADTVDAARAAAALGPDMVAIEPPELIGGDVSVTSADPAIVEDAVAAVEAVAPQVDVLCGAGVKTGDDVAAALELGTVGVLLASGVAKADDPEKVVQDLLEGLDR